MADLLLDSSILIDALNNHPQASRYLDRLTLTVVIHAICQAEVIEGTRSATEQRAFLRYLRRYSLVHASESDSKSALSFLPQFHLSHDIGFADCLIAATALRLELTVVTVNDRHFRLFPGLKVIRPY